MGWLAPHPGRFTPGKETRYPLYRRLGGPQDRSGRLWKISPPPAFDPRTVQPVASRYTEIVTSISHILSCISISAIIPAITRLKGDLFPLNI
jgi:hypothetical protein